MDAFLICFVAMASFSAKVEAEMKGWQVAVPSKNLTEPDTVKELGAEYIIKFNYRTLSSHNKISIGADGIQPYSNKSGLVAYFMINGTAQNFTIPTTINNTYEIQIAQEKESNATGSAIDFIIRVDSKIVFTSKNIIAVNKSNVSITFDAHELPISEYNEFTVYNRATSKTPGPQAPKPSDPKPSASISWEKYASHKAFNSYEVIHSLESEYSITFVYHALSTHNMISFGAGETHPYPTAGLTLFFKASGAIHNYTIPTITNSTYMVQFAQERNGSDYIVMIKVDNNTFTLVNTDAKPQTDILVSIHSTSEPRSGYTNFTTYEKGWTAQESPTTLTSMKTVPNLGKEFKIEFNYKCLSSHNKINLGAPGNQTYPAEGLTIYFMANGMSNNVTIPTKMNMTYKIIIAQELKNGSEYYFWVKADDNMTFFSMKNKNVMMVSNMTVSIDAKDNGTKSEYTNFVTYKRGGWSLDTLSERFGAKYMIKQLQKEYKITFTYKAVAEHSKISIGGKHDQPYTNRGLAIYFDANGGEHNFTLQTVANTSYSIEIYQLDNGTAFHFTIEVDKKTVFTVVNSQPKIQEKIWVSTDSDALPRSMFIDFVVYKKGMSNKNVSCDGYVCGANAKCAVVDNKQTCTCDNGFFDDAGSCGQIKKAVSAKMRVTSMSYSSELADTNSAKFLSTAKTMADELRPVITAKVTGAKDVNVYGFAMGSLIVSYFIIMDENTTINTTSLTTKVASAISGATFSKITADKSYSFTIAVVDKCAHTQMNNCHKNAKCTTVGDSYSCACAPGYSGNGTWCSDDLISSLILAPTPTVAPPTMTVTSIIVKTTAVIAPTASSTPITQPSVAPTLPNNGGNNNNAVTVTVPPTVAASGLTGGLIVLIIFGVFIVFIPLICWGLIAAGKVTCACGETKGRKSSATVAPYDETDNIPMA